ncbi:MAG: cysteine methyltransferase [Paenibacillus sp.]|jgi:methylated-DNA-[protein]-cysteine S-methyltransferase|nr:cysteine methyltransferase [Paenibacillus sp.]
MTTPTTTINRIYWSVLEDAHWTLHIAALEDGLCFIGSHGQSVDELDAWAKARYPKHHLIRNDEMLLPYKEELTRYFQGELQQFSLPFAVQGTPFQEAVWRALQQIPYGQTCSYSDIALSIQKPASVRAVGAAIGANPLLITIPCHRVIGKNGALTGYRGGIEMKVRLLELEKSRSQPVQGVHHG